MKISKREGRFLFILIFSFILTRSCVEFFTIALITPPVFVSNFPFIIFLFSSLFVLLYFVTRIKWSVLAAGFYILHSIFLFSQINYYIYYNVPMDFFAAFAVAGDGVLAFLKGSVAFDFKMLLPFIDLPVFILFILFYKKIRIVFGRMRWKKWLLLSAAITAAIYHPFMATIECFRGEENTRAALIKTHGPLGFSLLKKDLLDKFQIQIVFSSEVVDNTVIIRDGDNKIVSMTNGLDYGKRKWPGIEEDAFNFLFIQVESLQSGLEHMTYKETRIMPYLHELSSQSLYYPYCFAYHTAGGTSDCETSLFNNIEPKDGARLKTASFAHENSFVKRLGEYSYNAYAFHNYTKVFYDRINAYKKIGFKAFYDFYDMGLSGSAWGSEDRLMYEFILDHAEDWERPFLDYVITLSSHPGFAHINNYFHSNFLAKIKSKRDRDALSCFVYVDMQLAKFIPEFRKRFPNTYIFIYGDHSLATIDFAGKLIRSGVTVGEDYLEFVPLFIITPDNLAKKYDSVLASFHDLGPTVLSLLPRREDREYIEYAAFGGSLLFDDYSKMKVPFNGTLYDRELLLQAIKTEMAPYIE